MSKYKFNNCCGAGGAVVTAELEARQTAMATEEKPSARRDSRSRAEGDD